MALAFDAASGAKTDTASSLTFSHTCSGSDRLLIVTTGALGFPPVAAPTGVTYNGVAMTQIWTEDYLEVFALEIRSEAWYLVAPATGANNVVATWALGAEHCASSVSFTGSDQSSPLGTPATAQGASAPATVDAGSSAGDIVIDGARIGQPTITVGAGQTSRNEQENINFSSAGGSSTEPGGGTITMSWTMGAGGYGDKWAMGAVAVKPVAAAGGDTFFEGLQRIEDGLKPWTAAGLGGVLVE